jgi:hypothetical protein
VQSRDENLTSPQNNNHNREVANCKREIKEEQFDSQHQCVSVALQIRLLLFRLHPHCPSNPKKENTTLLISTQKPQKNKIKSFLNSSGRKQNFAEQQQQLKQKSPRWRISFSKKEIMGFEETLKKKG